MSEVNITVQETVENVEIVAQNNVIEVNITRQSGGGGGAVDSVNGQTGVVVLDATDVDALQRDGSNANSDVDLGAFSLNAKSFHAKGTNGSGHLGLRHQNSNPTAGGQETVIFAGNDGEPRYKNDGNAIEQLASQSFVNNGLATKENTIPAGTTSQYYRGDKTFQTLNVSAVSGLQTALDNKQSKAIVQDISLLVTINGVSSVTTRKVWYIDNDTFGVIFYEILGISNSTSFSMTLPFNINGFLTANPSRITNNSALSNSPGWTYAGGNSFNVVFVINGSSGTVGWTSSGNKGVTGQINFIK